MEAIRSLFSDQIIEAIGWVLFHSSWQATLLLVLLIVALVLMKSFSARVRNFVAYSTLLLILGSSIATGIKSYQYAHEKQLLKERLITSSDGMTHEIKALLVATEGAPIKKPSEAHLKWINVKTAVQSNFHIVFSLWLLGILFFLLRMAGGMVYLHRLTKQQVLPLETIWQDKLEALKERLSISKPIKACQSYVAKVPMIAGHLKPVILVPISLFTALTPQEIEAIIAHELAHIKRHDYLFNILQSIIETLFFFHPAVWIVSRIIRDEREHSCDDLAIAITGDKLNYIKALASAQQLTLQTHYNAVAFTQNKGGLLTRVKRLKTLNTMKNKVTERFFAAALIFISLILVSATGIYNKSNDDYLYHFNRMINASTSAQAGLIEQESLTLPLDTLEKRVKQKVEELEEVPEEVEQVIEVALSEQNVEMAAEILQSVEEALAEVEWAEIEKETLREVEQEMKNLNLDSIMDAAMVEAHAEIAEEIEAIRENDLQSAKDAMAIDEMALKNAKMGIEIAKMT
ncbi:MAG: M56 family metallopeptidase, partial [Marinilabiliaceae bacterium]|nr:M56 family metallopeptidase [Marinilabiliaceae bacterium]